MGFPLSVGCIALNALTIILMTIDRHDCVVRPFRRRLSTENVKKILLLTWLVAFIITAVLLVLLTRERSVCYTWFPYNQPNSFRTEQGNVTVILIFLTTIAQLDTLAILLAIITFFRVLKTLRAPTCVQSTKSSLHQRREKQLTWLTCKICGTYILSRFPLLICSLASGSRDDANPFRVKSSSSFQNAQSKPAKPCCPCCNTTTGVISERNTEYGMPPSWIVTGCLTGRRLVQRRGRGWGGGK